MLHTSCRSAPRPARAINDILPMLRTLCPAQLQKYSCKLSSHRKALINIFHGTRCVRRTQAARRSARRALLLVSLKPFSNSERRPIDPGRGRESVLYILVHVVTSKHFFGQHNRKSEFLIVCTQRSSVTHVYLQLRSKQLTAFVKGHIQAG